MNKLLLCYFALNFLYSAKSAVYFSDVPVGTTISFDHYQQQGLLLFTDPGQTIFTISSFGINSSYGPCLFANGNGHITLEFVVPGTTIPGVVSSDAIQAIDNSPGGANYYFTSFDVNNQQTIQLGNNHDYLIGEGYSEDPGTNRIEFVPGNPTSQFINSVGFSDIKPAPEASTLTCLILGGIVAFSSRKRSRL